MIFEFLASSLAFCGFLKDSKIASMLSLTYEGMFTYHRTPKLQILISHLLDLDSNSHFLDLAFKSPLLFLQTLTFFCTLLS